MEPKLTDTQMDEMQIQDNEWILQQINDYYSRSDS